MDPIAETSRLRIRPLCLKDVAGLTEILSDPEVMKYSIRGVCDAAATRAFVEWCMNSYQAHGLGPWALVEKATSSLVGFCGVGPEQVGDVEEMSLGYRLARRYWGQGLATESAHAVLHYGFGIKGCESVVAIIEPEHVASLRVAEKVGFRGFQETVFHGKAVRLYRLSRDEWARLSAAIEGKMTERLFVYGTLGPGRPNEHVLNAVGGSWDKATVTGTLRQEGWGAAMGFPGIDLDEESGSVEGFLFSSDNLADHWTALDEFEGDAYQRVLTKVKLTDGSMADAYIYRLRKR